MSTSAQFMDRVLQGHTDGWSSSQQMSSHFFKSCRGVVDMSLALYPGVSSSIPGSPSRSDETLSYGPSSETF